MTAQLSVSINGEHIQVEPVCECHNIQGLQQERQDLPERDHLEGVVWHAHVDQNSLLRDGSNPIVLELGPIATVS